MKLSGKKLFVAMVLTSACAVSTVGAASRVKPFILESRAHPGVYFGVQPDNRPERTTSPVLVQGQVDSRNAVRVSLPDANQSGPVVSFVSLAEDEHATAEAVRCLTRTGDRKVSWADCSEDGVNQTWHFISNILFLADDEGPALSLNIAATESPTLTLKQGDPALRVVTSSIHVAAE